MTLSALIKKGGIATAATATLATIATPEADQALTVAEVATVAVTVKPEPPIHTKRKSAKPELLADEESRIRAWLAHIEETDSDIIAEVLEKCRADTETRRYFLKRAAEVSHPVGSHTLVTCSGCANYERIDHPSLGHCAKGEPEAIAGLWDSDQRYCKQFTPILNENGDHDAGLIAVKDANGKNPITDSLDSETE